MSDQSHSLAVFIDYENLARGVGVHGHADKASASKKAKASLPSIAIVFERLVEKGKIVVKRAYCDWQNKYKQAVVPLHELGIELTEIPERRVISKNSADIRLVVDAMEMCHAKQHIDTFVIVSGDSDFTPLVLKLKENGKTVIGVGPRDATSEILSANCDEFIYYEDIAMAASGLPSLEKIEEDKRPAFKLLIDAIEALQREDVDPILPSQLKNTIRRKQPQFTERAYGYARFNDLLQDAKKRGLIEIRKDEKSGTWAVEGFVS